MDKLALVLENQLDGRASLNRQLPRLEPHCVLASNDQLLCSGRDPLGRGGRARAEQ
jgi:hypothetical protein